MTKSDIECGKKTAVKLARIVALLWIAGSYLYLVGTTLLLASGFAVTIFSAISYLGICFSFAWVSHDMVEGWFYPSRNRIGRAQTRLFEKIGSITRKKRGC
jgi:hypothetical protein